MVKSEYYKPDPMTRLIRRMPPPSIIHEAVTHFVVVSSNPFMAALPKFLNFWLFY